MKILWIPHDSWQNPQRAKIFCQKLSEKHEVHVTDWNASMNKISDFVSLEYVMNFFYRTYKDRNITVHHIPRISPALFSKRLRDFNSKLFLHYVQKIIDNNEIDAVIGSFVCPPPNAKKLVYDIFDDNPAYWREFGNVLEYADEMEKVEILYLKKADEIIVVSNSLLDNVAKYENVHLIPNGIDLSKFKNVNIENVRLIRKRLNSKRPIIGFIGNHGTFSGLSNVIEVANKITDVDFLIVGGGSEVEMFKHVEKKSSNIVFTGKVEFSNIQDYYNSIDIGLLPFIKKDFTDNACPIKLLEYTAAGKPVVSTDLEEVKRMNFSNVILVKDNPKSLAEGIKKALNTQLEIPEKIKEYDINRLVEKYEEILSS